MPIKNPFSVRKKASQERSQKTVDAILEATTRILMGEATDKITTNSIAEKAGVSIGSLYQYFPTKEAILAQLVERYLDRKLDWIEKVVGDMRELPVEQAIDRMIDVFIDEKTKNLKVERALILSFSRSGDFKLLRRIDEKVIERLDRIFESFEGQIRKTNRRWTAFVAFQALRGVLFSVLTHRPDEIRDSDLRKELKILMVGFLSVK